MKPSSIPASQAVPSGSQDKPARPTKSKLGGKRKRRDTTYRDTHQDSSDDEYLPRKRRPNAVAPKTRTSSLSAARSAKPARIAEPARKVTAGPKTPTTGRVKVHPQATTAFPARKLTQAHKGTAGSNKNVAPSSSKRVKVDETPQSGDPAPYLTEKALVQHNRQHDFGAEAKSEAMKRKIDEWESGPRSLMVKLQLPEEARSSLDPEVGNVGATIKRENDEESQVKHHRQESWMEIMRRWIFRW